MNDGSKESPPVPADPRFPSAHQAVQVPLGDRSYTISIGAGLLNQVDSCLRPWIKDRHVVIISDSRVAPLYLATLESSLNSETHRLDTFIIPEGEASKSLAVCEQAWNAMLRFAADRSSLVVALGGGVVGDLAGFIAATFGRGIDFIQVPTSMLAQVDSSVGGKVGINLPNAKNMVGAFWQPQTVVIDTDVLSTLDDRNFRAGLAEVAKYGLIMDLPLFEFLERSISLVLRKDPATLIDIIAKCCQAKAEVVVEDETEQSGRRAILNYGHTFGHAIESVFGYGTFLHGEAIAIGMNCAARLAIAMGRVDTQFLDRQNALFQAFGLPTECPAERHDELLQAMKRDKKVAQGRLKLILPVKLGEVESVPAPDDQLILDCLHNA